MCIYFDIIRKAIINYMSKVVNIQSSGSYICGNQQLEVLYPEFLHNCITLHLRQIAMKCIGIISIVNKFRCYFLGLFPGTAKYNSINVRFKISNTFEYLVLILYFIHL